MLKSCSYCGRIHDEKYVCEQKKKAKELQQSKPRKHSAKYVNYTRNNYWNKLSKWIRDRDLYICQVCGKQANEVHHIIKIEEDTEKAYDENNLISLCHKCHLLAERGLISKDKLFDKVKESIKKFNERMGY